MRLVREPKSLTKDSGNTVLDTKNYTINIQLKNKGVQDN